MEDDAAPVDSQHERFSNGITDLYVTMEDLRQSLRSFETTTDSNRSASDRITIDLLQEWQSLMDRMVQITYFLLQLIPNEKNETTGDTTAEEVEMLQHSMSRALDVTQRVLQLCCSQYLEPTADSFLDDGSLPSIEEQRRIGQSAVASIAEMNIILAFHSNLRSPSSPSDTNDAMKNIRQVPNMEEILQQYVQFQRRTFRLRCKPSIAELVDLRRQQNLFAPPERASSTTSSGIAPSSWSNDESAQALRRTEQEQRFVLLLKQYHAPVFAMVLGVAATLIHPLAAWMTHVVPLLDKGKDSSCTIPSYIHRLCRQSIAVIHEQAEALVKSVSEWFYVDRKYIFDLSSVLDDPKRCSTTNNPTMPREQQIGLLTAVVDEMAYIAQLLERYRALVDSCTGDEGDVLRSNGNLIASSILPEWIWQYSALERQLVAHQWRMSVVPSEGNDIRAAPVCIVIGTEIRVSSCIEDAQYITSQAMERAMSTQSLHAMATIAYAIVRDIWATESLEEQSSKSAMTVYQALWEEIGCWSEPESSMGNGSDAKRMPNVASPSSGGGGFATALLDALDEDMDPPHTAVSVRSPNSNPTSPSKPPRSGGTSFLSSLISSGVGNEPSTQRQLDTFFCVCNSLYASAGACRGFVNTLDEILQDYSDLPMDASNVKADGNHASGQGSLEASIESRASQSEVTKKAVSLIHLARDELLQYSGRYQELLSDRIGASVRLWCFDHSREGPNGRRCSGCLDALRQFFSSENYDINGSTFTDMEVDERLEKEMLMPLKQSPLLSQMRHKCEAPIIHIFSERIATVVVDMLLDLLWMMDGVGTSDVNHENNGTYHSTKRSDPMRFTDWGALLLSKQSRMLQHYISVTMTQGTDGSSASADSSNGVAATMTTSMAVYQIWERFSEALTILQLEKPMDWLIYHSTSKLTPDEVSRTMRLRVDFSNDAVEKVVKDIRGKRDATYSSKS